MSVVMEIVLERARQLHEEGWTPEHDDAHVNGEIAAAASAYAANARGRGSLDLVASLWPWDWSWWKPTNPRRDLIKAAALIVAEIERLDRAHDKPPE